MQEIKIKLVALGNLKFPLNFNRIEEWNSSIFQLRFDEIVQLLPNPDEGGWSYSDTQLSSIVKHDNSYHFTVGIINAPLQHNYYVRRLEDSVAILSLHEITDILKASNLSIEKFVIRSMYGLCCYFEENGRVLPSSKKQSHSHNETRGCIFDKTINKADIVFSTAEPKLCSSCENRLKQSQVSKDLVILVQSELRKIKKDLYYRLSDFIKEHPIHSIIISTAVALTIDTLGNYIYDLIKAFLPFLKVN
jgi:hypothetical protein